MNADEIVKGLRVEAQFQKDRFSRFLLADAMFNAADLIESMQAKNKALLREVCNLACESVEREKTLAKLESEVMAGLHRADAVPVVRCGEWICNPDNKKFSLVCSVCGQVMPFVPEYLPDNPPFCNCGADMRGSEVKE